MSQSLLIVSPFIYLSPIGSVSLENPNTFGFFICFLPPHIRGKGLFMDLSKQSELQNGMGLRNHVIEFFVFFLNP